MPVEPSIPPPPPPQDQFIADQDAADSGADDDDDSDKAKGEKKAGRRKIKIEFIQDKSRRHITFSKRKAGIMKKAYELSTLTGTQVLLLVVSETGLVYTFTTAKLQPLVTQPEGKNLIQACLNAPHGQLPSSMPIGQPLGRAASMGGPHHSNVPGGLSIGAGKDDGDDGDGEGDRPGKRRRRASTAGGRNTRNSASAAVNPPQSPHSPAQPGAPPLSIPQGGQHPGASQPQSAMPIGPSPTSASPSQAPTSPHYAHSSPNTTYHTAPGQEIYPGQQGGLMAPPQGPPGGQYPSFNAPGQGAATGHWPHGTSTVQGGNYGRR
ncbi:SRF-TF-domain-containing protein [Stereum hirsutum FP-91666 SS1]|uniref:SRF-TF-domain-containing protein n=1 Tax=Stereum hirsutum (strain FP-91666) TaxID=721885 RepID=UPI0004449A27|nr:SRF-TF-domain-containing protein [Stereum hirsutum FP-91666 SS1]EIM85966.1 SRF-TF-domain-containing protein [Stereum hirsutum FP-91666 SS1]